MKNQIGSQMPRVKMDRPRFWAWLTCIFSKWKVTSDLQ
jgi:hypothetical protein